MPTLQNRHRNDFKPQQNRDLKSQSILQDRSRITSESVENVDISNRNWNRSDMRLLRLQITRGLDLKSLALGI